LTALIPCCINTHSTLHKSSQKFKQHALCHFCWGHPSGNDIYARDASSCRMLAWQTIFCWLTSVSCNVYAFTCSSLAAEPLHDYVSTYYYPLRVMLGPGKFVPYVRRTVYPRWKVTRKTCCFHCGANRRQHVQQSRRRSFMCHFGDEHIMFGCQ